MIDKTSTVSKDDCYFGWCAFLFFFFIRHWTFFNWRFWPSQRYPSTLLYLGHRWMMCFILGFSITAVHCSSASIIGRKRWIWKKWRRRTIEVWGFRRGVVQSFALLRCYAIDPEDGTDRFSQNVGNQISTRCDINTGVIFSVDVANVS